MSRVRFPRRVDALLIRNQRRSPWRRVYAGVTAVFAITMAGTIGYMLLGLTPFDSLYQTVITITTVGFAEIGGDNIDTQYRMWSLFLVVVGTLSALYTVSVFVEAVIEDNLNDRLRRRRMRNRIEELSDHVVVAGWGRVGQAIGEFVRRMGHEVVVIDNDPDVDSSGYLRIEGHATEDSVLLAAGIRSAHSLIAALPNDPDNVYITLSARALCPDLYIVARTSHSRNEAKFTQAGANRVVNPHQIGGSRMGAVAMQPHVAEFFDEVLHDDEHDVAVIEFTVPSASRARGMEVGELSHPGDERALVVALRKDGRGDYLPNPDPDVILSAGDVIIAVGSAVQLKALGRMVGDIEAAAEIQLGHMDDTFE